MTDKPDIERESFNDLVSQRRLAALAARIEAPTGTALPSYADPRTGATNEPALPSYAPGNLGTLAGVVSRLTFSEMMTLAEGIVHKLPGQNGPGALEPFALAIGLRDWAAE